eukprot:jgi/Mesen1/1878/ME000143S00931
MAPASSSLFAQATGMPRQPPLPNTGQLVERVDEAEEEISFEELLAQEKKDSFWQRHGPARASHGGWRAKSSGSMAN